MKTYLIAAAAAAAAFLACAPCAWAGGPYVVDDAGTTPAGRCQLEAWVARGPDDRVWVAAPACATRGGWSTELTLGLREHNGETYVSPAAKRTFASVADGRISVAGSVAVDLHTGGAPSTATLNIPVSFQASDALLIHLNLGWVRTGGEARTTWGINAEQRLTSRLTAIAETFGDAEGTSGWQAGVRHALAPGRLDLDLTVGEPDTARGGVQWTLGLAAGF